MRFCAALIVFCFAVKGFAAADTVTAPLRDYQATAVLVDGIAFGREARTRVELCRDYALRIYDMATGALTRTIKMPPGWWYLGGSSYVEDGLIVLQGDSNFVRVDLASGQATQIPGIKALGGNAHVHYAADFTRAVLQGADSSHYLVDFRTGVVRKCFGGFLKTIDYAGFSGDGIRVIALRNDDSTARVWDMQTDSLLFTSTLPIRIFNKAAFTPDGLGVAVALSASKTRGFAVLDLATGNVARIDTSLNCNLGSYAWPGAADFLFTSDGGRLIFGTGPTVSAFSYPILLCRETDTRPNRNSSAAYMGRWIDPGDSLVYTQVYDKMGKYYELHALSLKTGKSRLAFAKQYRPNASYGGFTAQGEPILIGTYNYTDYESTSGIRYADTVVFWNAVTDKEILRRTGRPFSSMYFGGSDFAFNPEGTRLFEWRWAIHDYGDGLISLVVHKIDPATTGPDSLFFRKEHGTDPVVTLDRRGICTFDSTTATVHDILTGDSTRIPFRLPRGWTAIAVAPALDIAFACSTSQASSTSDAIYHFRPIRFHGQDSLGPTRTAANDWIHDNSFKTWPTAMVTPDGKRYLVSNLDGSTLYEISTGKALAFFKENGGHSSLSPDGKHVIALDRCYSAVTGELERVYPYPEAAYRRLAFNPLDFREFLTSARVYAIPGPAMSIASRSSRKSHAGSAAYWNVAAAVLDWPDGAGSEAWLTILRADGRQVHELRLERTGARQIVPLPAIPDGAYTYRLTAPFVGPGGLRLYFLP